jgi:hypothetical protein
MEINSNRKKYFTELIISNLNPRDLTEDVIINQIKNKIFRQHAIKHYHVLKSDFDRTLQPFSGDGFYYKDGRLYKGKWSKKNDRGYIITGEKYVLECHLNNFIPSHGKGQILIDNKIITVNSISKGQDEQFCITGEIGEIKTGEIFKGQFLAGFDKIYEVFSGEGVVYTKGSKYSGEMIKQDEYHENDENTTQVVLNKFKICDNDGNEFSCEINSHLFPIKYQGKFAYDGNLYEGNFTKDYFEGKVTNQKDPSLIYQGKCNESGLPLTGQGLFLYKNVIFEGQYNVKFLQGKAYLPDNPDYFFEGKFKRFFPHTGKGKFIHQGTLYEGEVIKKKKINAVVKSRDDKTGQEYLFNLKMKDDVIMGDGELKFGNFIFKGKWQSEKYANGEIFWKGKKVYEGFFRNFRIDGEGFLGFNGNILHNNLIYSLNC